MRRLRSRISIYLCALFAGILVTSMAAAQQPGAQEDIQRFELGDREHDKVYPLTLTAQNLDCNSPQDFRFDLTQAPWIIALADPIVRQVPPGGQGSTPAQLNFFNTDPGPHEVVVTIICETCGYIPFIKNCRADKREVTISVNVLPAEAPQTAQLDEAAQDEVAGVHRDQSDPALALPVENAPAYEGEECLADASFSIDSDLEEHLTGGQRAKLDGARRAASDAEAVLVAANEKVADLTKKKNDCWDELARMRADQAAKEAEADAAEDVATAAQGAVDKGPKKDVEAAQKEIDDFQKDVDAAQREYDRWTEAAQAQQDYLEIVISQEGGLDSQRGKNAKEYYEEAAANREDARDALDQVKNSMAARQAALDAAQKALDAAQAAADAKKADAATKKAAANAAKEAADAKERECLGLDEQIKAAKQDAESASRDKKTADRDADRAERNAEAQAAANLDDAIACKKGDCERIKKMWDEHFRKMDNARKALEQIGYYKAQAASPKKPSSLWDDYKELGYDKFIEVTATAAGLVLPASAPTAGNFMMLFDILKVAYYGVAIRQSTLTPTTAAHGRTEGATLRKFLIDNELAGKKGQTDKEKEAEAKEVEKLMEELMHSPDAVYAKYLARAIEQLEKCKAELAALEAKRAAARR